MSSFDVLHTESNSGSFPSGDYSFLPEVSVHSVQNGTVTHINESYNLANIQSALSTTSSDPSMEEVNAQLMELLDENRSLKDILNRNNLLMKDEMGTIFAWREKMIMSMTDKQQKLEKAKEKISLLEKENDDLRSKLSSLEMECLDLRNLESCKNCESIRDALRNLQKEREAAEKARELLLGEINEVNNFHKQLRNNLMAIHNHLDNLYCTGKLNDRQKEELNNILICLRLKMSVLTEDCGSITHIDDETGYVIIKKQQKIQTSEELTLHTSTEIENLKMELKEKTKKLEDAEVLLHQNASEMEHLSMSLGEKSRKLDLFSKQEKQLSETVKAYDKNMQDSENRFKSELEELKEKLDIEFTLRKKYKERCQSMQQVIDDYQVKFDSMKKSDEQSVVQLREESMNLQEILSLEQRDNQKDKEKLASLMLKCEKLQVDYDRVTKLLRIQSKDEKSMAEELTVLRQNGTSHMEAVDHLTARVMDLELRLEEKEEDMKKLIEELVSVKEEAEMVPILQAQVDLHKTDLEQAVSTRDSAYAEIEKLEKDLRKHKGDHDSSGYSSYRKKDGRK